MTAIARRSPQPQAGGKEFAMVFVPTIVILGLATMIFPSFGKHFSLDARNTVTVSSQSCDADTARSIAESEAKLKLKFPDEARFVYVAGEGVRRFKDDACHFIVEGHVDATSDTGFKRRVPWASEVRVNGFSTATIVD